MSKKEKGLEQWGRGRFSRVLIGFVANLEKKNCPRFNLLGNSHALDHIRSVLHVVCNVLPCLRENNENRISSRSIFLNEKELNLDF
jgi:hypothetical protein